MHVTPFWDVLKIKWAHPAYLPLSLKQSKWSHSTQSSWFKNLWDEGLRWLEWLPFPFPGDLFHPGIEPGSPALQADSLLTELRGKPTCEYMWGKYRESQKVQTFYILKGIAKLHSSETALKLQSHQQWRQSLLLHFVANAACVINVIGTKNDVSLWV